MGYTGDPFSRCIDIDECGHYDLNTCSGGMNPGGVSADITLYMEENRVFYLGEPDDDGFSQAVQFELKGNAMCKFFFNSEDKNFNSPKVYKIFPQNGKFKLKYDGQFRANGPWTPKNRFQIVEFSSYVFRFVLVSLQKIS